MIWHPVLFGCFVSGGRAYGFDVAPPVVQPVMAQIIAARIQGTCWFAGSAGHLVYFGLRDEVGAQLGWDHPSARDHVGRRLEFMLAYAAASGTPLPGHDELLGLRERFRADLQLLGELARKTERVVKAPVPVTLPAFRPPHHPATAWDQAVSEIMAQGRPWAVLGPDLLGRPAESLPPYRVDAPRATPPDTRAARAVPPPGHRTRPEPVPLPHADTKKNSTGRRANRIALRVTLMALVLVGGLTILFALAR